MFNLSHIINLEPVAEPDNKGIVLDSEMEIFDIFEDIVNLNSIDNKYQLLVESRKTLSRASSFIALNGITEEITALIGPQLAAKEIDIVSNEAMIEGIEKVAISLEGIKVKELMKAMMDGFVRIMEKLFDANRSLTNQLQEFADNKLADVGAYNEDKFKASVGVMFNYNTAKSLVKFFTGLDYHKVIVLEKDELVISKDVVELLSKVGYIYSDGKLSRDDKFAINRERLSEHGYQMNDLKSFVLTLIAGMKKVRISAGNTISDLKSESSKADTPELAAAFRERINATRPVIIAIERISNILTRQVLGLSSALVDKTS